MSLAGAMPGLAMPGLAMPGTLVEDALTAVAGSPVGTMSGRPGPAAAIILREDGASIGTRGGPIGSIVGSGPVATVTARPSGPKAGVNPR